MDVKCHELNTIDGNDSELDLNLGPINIESTNDSLTNLEEELHEKISLVEFITPENSGQSTDRSIITTKKSDEECPAEHDENSFTSKSAAILFFDDNNIASDVTKKIVSGAFSVGNFLFSAASAGTQILERGIFGEFNKEQTSFINDQNKPLASQLPPWVGYINEDHLREECLSLSGDRQNFLRSPPTVSEFKFDYNICYPIAEAIMKDDQRLEELRYKLVPKLICEEHFWRNYFYRVGLIFQANEADILFDLDYRKDRSIEMNENSCLEELNFTLEDCELVNESIS